MLKVKLFLIPGIVLVFNLSNAQNNAFVHQLNGAQNSEIQLTQIGDNNLLNGFKKYSFSIKDAEENFHEPAYQFSSDGGSNRLITNQTNSAIGKNEIFLYQEAFMNNSGIFNQQDGSHTIILNENSSYGSNASHINQLNGISFINLEQIAYLNNTIPSATSTIMDNPFGYTGIYQEGENNFIYGATKSYDSEFELVAVLSPDLPAQQISETGSNWLEIWQTGGNNVVGLHQEAINSNEAYIHQYNGFNIAVIYQQGVGPNSVRVEQSGGAEAYIYQNGGGNNNAVILQH